MDDSEFRDGTASSNRFTAGEAPPVSEILPNRTQVTTSPPSVRNGYDPYTLVFRIVLILCLLGLLFVAALYYGVINP